jgi:hypothetical protein
MAEDRHQLAAMTADDSQGWLANFLAEEGEWNRRSLWQLGSWAVASVGALVIAFLALHASMGQHRDQIAAIDVARQSQQIQWIAREGQTETRRLSSAIETLNGDRDRLYARVTVLEQGLESVTGSVTRQTVPPSLVMSSATQLINLPQPPAISVPASLPTPASEAPPSPPPQAETAAMPAPAAHAAAPAAVARAPLKELLPAATLYAPPDPAAPKLIEAQPVPPAVVAAKPEKAHEIIQEIIKQTKDAKDAPAAPAVVALAPETAVAAGGTPEIAVQRTEFGVDLGGANSVEGLRALWQGLLKSNPSLVASLRPIIVIKERNNGLGLQLRLVAGPLSDAAAAARICAGLAENDRLCETSVFDGQRLALKAATEGSPSPAARPARKRTSTRHSRHEEPAPAPQPAPQPPPQASTSSTMLSGFFRSR